MELTGEPQPHRFEVLDTRAVLEMPPPTWLVEEVLPARGIAVLYGTEGVGKTFLALDWALAIASARNWQHRRVAAGPVLFVASEGVGGGLGTRVRAWLQNHAADADQLPARFLLQPVRLLDSGHEVGLHAIMERLCEELHQPIALVVFDTLARAIPGEEENSARVMGKLVEVLERLRDQFATTVLVIHHARKQGDSERGSNALAAGADSVFRMRAGSGSNTISLTCMKQRDAPPFSPLHLRRVSVPLAGTEQTSCVLEASIPQPDRPEGAVYRSATRDAERMAAVLSVLRGAVTGATITEIQRHTNLPSSAIRKLLHSTEGREHGVVKAGKQGKAEVYKLDATGVL